MTDLQAPQPQISLPRPLPPAPQYVVPRSALQPAPSVIAFAPALDMPFGSAPPIIPTKQGTTATSPQQVPQSSETARTAGIGAFWRVDGGNRLVLDRFAKGSSAKEAGLAPGDQLAAVDGITIERRTVDAVAAQLMGPVGSKVNLVLYREGQPFMVVVRRRFTEKQISGIGVFWAPDAPVKLLGIGAFWTEGEGGRIVLEEFARYSPAEKAGLMIGDELLGVDGVSVQNRSWEDVFSLVMGPAGSTVALDVLRTETQRMTVLVRRDHINFKSSHVRRRMVLNHFAHFSPGQRAGLLVGDELVAVNGVRVADLEYHAAASVMVGARGAADVHATDTCADRQVVDRIVGENETQVVLDIRRGTAPTTRMVVMRDSLESRLAQLDNFDAEMQNGGIGITWAIEPTTGRLVVAAFQPFSSAQVAGMQLFDELVAVDGEVVGGLPAAQITKRLTGRVGTKVRVQVRRQGVLYDLTITRVSL